MVLLLVFTISIQNIRNLSWKKKEVYTPRFWSKEGQRLEFTTNDEDYLLEPSTIEKNKIDNKKLGEHFSFQNKDRDKEAGYIECKALKINEFFLDFDGNVLPCCWLGNSLNRKNEPWLKDTLRYADNMMNWYNPKTMNAIDNDLTDVIIADQVFNNDDIEIDEDLLE